MIAELFFIVDLLGKSSFGSTPPTSQPKQQAKKHKQVSLNLGYVGKIEKITQPVTGVYLTPREAANAYLKAGTGRPEKIGTGGRF